jgi:O-acetyl-ADP-ribose deacetylase (regulator of RNase III)
VQVRICESDLELIKGDITDQEADAIVCPANRMLKLGAGVAGAIHRKGGPMIQRECDEIGGASVGSAVITTAGELPAKHVIHAVGPKQGEGEEEEMIAAATEAVFDLCAKHGISTVAFPAISAGTFGVPVETSAEAMLKVALARLKQDGAPSRVTFCLYDFSALATFEETLARLRK